MGGEGEGGPTMCHKILLPSKGSNAWRNIPLLNLCSAIPRNVIIACFTLILLQKVDLPLNERQ